LQAATDRALESLVPATVSRLATPQAWTTTEDHYGDRDRSFVRPSADAKADLDESTLDLLAADLRTRWSL
jgi:hypothetical protein